MPIKLSSGKIISLRSYRKGKGAMSVAKRALRLARKATKAQETKYFDYVLGAGTDIGTLTDTNSYSMNEIAQGDTNNTRDGNKMLILGGCARFKVSCATGATTPIVVRAALILDKIPNGATVPTTLADNLYTVTGHGGSGTPAGGVAFWDHENNVEGRYKILKQRTFVLNPNNGAANRSKYIQMSYKFKKGITCQYEEGSSEPYRNRIFFLIWNGEEAVAGANNPSMSYMHRLYFKDA